MSPFTATGVPKLEPTVLKLAVSAACWSHIAPERTKTSASASPGLPMTCPTMAVSPLTATDTPNWRGSPASGGAPPSGVSSSCSTQIMGSISTG